jgi:hypothetical protein
MARWPTRKSDPPPVPEVRNDPVPTSVEWVEVWNQGVLVGRLQPLPPPPVGELVMVNGAIRRVIGRAYDAERRTARLEVS